MLSTGFVCLFFFLSVCLLLHKSTLRLVHCLYFCHSYKKRQTDRERERERYFSLRNVASGLLLHSVRL
uniref:Putative secreted peptide n=1 Tax=Anopheles braziliensis TaxID=58242 RepID=A0A2M3ZNK9_9DIPT